MQQTEGVRVAEVFELDAGLREDFLHCGEELLDHLVVRGAPQALLRQPDVERILEQRLVVRADVQRDRQALRGMDARAGGVQGELADRDAHAVRAEIAEAEDALAVGDDDDADVAMGPILQDLPDAPVILEGNIQSPRATENVAVLLAPLAHRRGVDDGHHLVEVVHDHAIEQALLAVLQREQVDVLLDVARLALEVFQHSHRLFLLRGNAGRQEAAQAQRIALRLGEGRSLVQYRRLQQIHPAFAVQMQLGRHQILLGNGLGDPGHVLLLRSISNYKNICLLLPSTLRLTTRPASL